MRDVPEIQDIMIFPMRKFTRSGSGDVSYILLF